MVKELGTHIAKQQVSKAWKHDNVNIHLGIWYIQKFVTVFQGSLENTPQFLQTRFVQTMYLAELLQTL